jgi:hypothetical protein
MNNKQYTYFVILLFLTAVFSLPGCGGGGSSTADGSGTGGGDVSFPSKILSWVPPSSYTDSTPLNPIADLDVFEIYVKTNGSFSAVDTPMAALPAVDPGSGQLATSFNLANLGPYLTRGVTYFVSIRTVAKNTLKSDFSAPASFSF